MAPKTEQGLRRLALRKGNEALAVVCAGLREDPAIDVVAERGRLVIVASEGDVGIVTLHATPETPGGESNGKTRITLRRRGIAQRQWPERSSGVPVDEIVATTRDLIGTWLGVDRAARDIGHSTYLLTRAQRTLQATADDVAVLSVSEGMSGSVRLLVDVKTRAALDKIVEALR